MALSALDLGVFRLLGPGLGNLLFPWARSVIAASEHDLVPIWPTWPQMKAGPLLRRERDARFYADLFKNPGDYVDGARKLWLLAAGRRSPEGSTRRPQSATRRLRPELITFSGLGSFFAPLLGHRDLLLRELIRMSRGQHLAGLNHDYRDSITVHLRLGDFLGPDERLLRSGAFNVQLPVRWARETVEELRAGVGRDWPVWLFSDGTDAQLQELLQLPRVRRLYFGSALADMLSMSRSQVLVVSSTFSMWPAFLGGVPSIYYPGQLRQRLLPDVPSGEVEREPGTGYSKDFLDVLHRRAIDV